MNDKTFFRTLFLSDLHLGSFHSRAGELSRFLDRIDCEHLYLVGDIVDLLEIRRTVHWPQAHQDVLHQLLDFARRGRQVTFIPGNHDHVARQFLGLELAGIPVVSRTVHETVDGRRLLVTHGDQFDDLEEQGFLTRLGDRLYPVLLMLDRLDQSLRRRRGLA